MTYIKSKRVLVRLLTFCAAALLICGGLFIQSRQEARVYRLALTNTYTRALGEFSSALVHIAADLEKQQYAGTPARRAQLAARVWKECASAKTALSNLPMGELHLDSAYKFLSQAGDYAVALSRKVGAGEQLSQEEVANARALYEYAVRMRDYVDILHQQMRSGKIPAVAQDSGPQAMAVSGFEDLEQTMLGVPTLIYDGPFSDHLLTRTSALTKNLPSVSAEQARRAAAFSAGLTPDQLTQGDDENSNMPSYTFQRDGISIGVTKRGGLVTYLLNDREMGDQRMSQKNAFSLAQTYLTRMGYGEMRASYFEMVDGVCIINYAAVQEGTLLYTDLVKVGVALDDGSIVFYEARGYLNNHHVRTLEPPVLSEQQAASSVSTALRIISVRPALIPTGGQGEVLTYEFLTEAKDRPGQQILVYINTHTGAEENILILLKTEHGSMTQ